MGIDGCEKVFVRQGKALDGDDDVTSQIAPVRNWVTRILLPSNDISTSPRAMTQDRFLQHGGVLAPTITRTAESKMSWPVFEPYLYKADTVYRRRYSSLVRYRPIRQPDGYVEVVTL